ncbi:hypothetical protein KC19_4G145400 [Ceratodon purpureus]|uniref:Uncharacterized protein n=1 Tax=Ceratodon purpureus TaxID=3225 RepID=A0A8T0IB87_CERPU|nr:hypothetical protein KC19_4G145400 [Ceratodon purpureus]
MRLLLLTILEVLIVSQKLWYFTFVAVLDSSYCFVCSENDTHTRQGGDTNSLFRSG